MIKRDHSAKNALKILYQKKYELDKDNEFKVPRLKVDIEAYLHRLLDAVEGAFETGSVVKYSGHELRWITKEEIND